MDEERNPIEQALRRLAAEDAQLGASPGVEAAVMAAFRARRKQRMRISWMLAAAALIAGIAVSLVWPGREPQPTAARVEQPAEIGTDYFPLRAGPVLDAGEIGRVIRVPVSRATMVRFGLNHAAVPGAASVNADVLLGMDGTARAVRFVQ